MQIFDQFTSKNIFMFVQQSKVLRCVRLRDYAMHFLHISLPTELTVWSAIYMCINLESSKTTTMEQRAKIPHYVTSRKQQISLSVKYALHRSWSAQGIFSSHEKLSLSTHFRVNLKIPSRHYRCFFSIATLFELSGLGFGFPYALSFADFELENSRFVYQKNLS